ncbi:MAG TPA: glycosyltransferase family 4 protein [Nitrospira sp.]|nr:glycosyltransferase family 4 protein [Nitrospira sp.]MCW5796058.1 glycosyltransferase family 4 protein [Nitrospira sp.]HMU30131.1 glycosyltransferase family 4 protein [Nitrospira sp.]HMV58413.1 glycosyltransferase family 4 protein [Nitrospira sp.]HMW86697.1 glycosyltransferase family 4 protein [Nitrospira sp.]
MKPIRVVIIRNCRGITGMTGGETYLLSLLKGFDPQKVRCLLVCIVNPALGETSWLRELKQTGFEHVTIPIGNPFNLSDVYKVSSLIRSYEADVVHALDHRSDLIGILSARLTGRPVLASFLGWVNFPKGSWRATVYPWIDRMILKRLDAVITDSVAIGTELKMREQDPPVVAIRNGIDTRWFDPTRTLTPFSQESFLKGGHFVFGMVGRIHPVKGHLNFLKAARTLLETHADCRFLIVGTVLPGFEHYRQGLQDFIREQGLEQSVLITHVSLAEIPAVFAGIDVLVAPSFAESFSFTLLEGMAMEKAVVSSEVGGAGEMITHGETGYLIPVDDVSRLTETMRMLRAAPEKVREVGLRARKKIVNDLGIEAMAARTHQVYRSLIEFKGKTSGGAGDQGRLREQLAMISAK